MSMRKIFLIGFFFPFLFCPLSSAQDAVPILIYHEIVDSPKEKPLSETVISLAQFQEQMAYLSAQGYITLSLSELVNFVKGQSDVPAKSVVLTFDDGWRSQRKVLPVLEQYHLKASFWIITGEGYGDVYFTPEEIKAIDAHPDWEVESHTVTHPWDPQSSLLTWLEGKPSGKSKEDVQRELADSKAFLEKLLQREVTMLAWPCGWYNETLLAMAQDAGYQVLFTTGDKSVPRGADPLQIPRFFVDGRFDLEAFKNILDPIPALPAPQL